MRFLPTTIRLPSLRRIASITLCTRRQKLNNCLVSIFFINVRTHRLLSLQEEVLAHDEEHRTLVRSAVKTAYQRCIWDAGMSSGGILPNSAHGETMEIGHGCFLVRPGRQEKLFEQPRGSDVPPTGGTTEALKMKSGAEPTENVSETRGVEVVSGSSSEDGMGLPRSGSWADEKEGGTIVPEEGPVGNADDTSSVVADVVSRELGEAHTGVEGGSTPLEGVDHSGLTDDTHIESNLTRSDKQAPDATENKERTKDGDVGDNPERNPILRALIQDMTRVGESLGMRSLDKARSKHYNTPGPSVIILLDSPLISPADPWLSPANGKYAWVSQHASDLVVRRSDVRKGVGAPVDTPPGSHDISPPPLVPLDDFDLQDDGGVGSDDQHPAGLGDPKEALEVLLSWVEEGGLSHSCGREVILVCGSDPQREQLDKSASKPKGGILNDSGRGEETTRDSGMGIPDSSPREAEFIVRTQSPASGSSPSDKDLEEDIHGDEAGVVEEDKPKSDNGQTDNEAEFYCHEREGGRSSGPTVRQIVLGKPFAPSIAQALKPHDGEDDVLHASDRPWNRGENFAENGSNDGRRLSKHAPHSQTHPRSARKPRKPTPANPFTVLLEVRPTTQIAGEPRVTATFPPVAIPTIAPAGHNNTAEINSTGEHEGEANTCGEELVQHQEQQLPAVIMGPVVGRVGPSSAVVLVEVNIASARTAELGILLGSAASDTVGVQLTDALSGRRHEVQGGRWVGEAGSGPRVFEFETLTPGRRYALRLMGVRKRDQVNIS